MGGRVSIDGIYSESTDSRVPLDHDGGKPHFIAYGEDKISGGFQPLPVDRSGRYVPILEAEHTRVHEGVAYICSGKTTGLNIGDNFDLLLKNPANNYPHLRVYRFDVDNAPADIYFYSAPTTTDDGTLCSTVNLNHNSSNTSDMTIYTGPTVTDAGTQKEYQAIIGSKQSGGAGEQLTVEHMLIPSTDYLIRFTSGANNTNLGFYVFFYEA